MGTPIYFVTTKYTPDEKGVYRPDVPKSGPCEDKEKCCLKILYYRDRKTGPRFPLAVVHCVLHEVSFTLYPPGHVPYGRISLTGLASNGVPLGRDPPFSSTYFDAALDAAAGITWPKGSYEGSMHPRLITQHRHLERCCLMLKLEEKMTKGREMVAEQLGIGGLALEEAQQILLGGGDRALGRGICHILDQLSETKLIFQRLATCGHYAEIWPLIQPFCSRER